MGEVAGGDSAAIKGLIKLSFEKFFTHKAAAKNSEFKSSVVKVLDIIKEKDVSELAPNDVYEALRLACQTRAPELVLESVDCVGKLFLCDYWISAARRHLNRTGAEAGERVKIDAPLGMLDSVNLLEQLTESDVFDMLIFSECLEYKIYSKLIGIISSTLVETTSSDPLLEIQVMKAFLAALSRVSRKAPIYSGVIYTRTFRAIYSIYCTSKSAQSQHVAQAALVQIISQVFESIANKVSRKINEYDKVEEGVMVSNKSPNTTDMTGSTILEKSMIDRLPLSTEDMQSAVLDSSDGNASPASASAVSARSESGSVSPTALPDQHHNDEKSEISAGGAAVSDPNDSNIVLSLYTISILCILTNRSSVIVSSHHADKAVMKIQALRSNLISLHLMHIIIKNYPGVLEMRSSKFGEYTSCDSYSEEAPSTLINACRKLLRLAVSTNLLNIHPQAFDITCQIVFILFMNHRRHMRNELSIILGEIILPILEAGINALTFHKMSIIASLGLALYVNMHEGKRALVEAYLNYDCDPRQGARSAIWKRLVNALAKIISYFSEPSGNNIFSVASANSIFGHYIPNPQMLISGFDNTRSVKFYRDAPINVIDYYMKSDFDALKVMSFNTVYTMIECLYHWINSDGKTPVSVPDYIKDKPGLAKNLDPSFINDSPTTIRLLRRKKDDVVSGVKVFNSDPRQSLDFLLETKVITSRSPKNIAHFLSTMSGLDKSAIGEFIGSGNEESKAVLKEFMAIQDYTDMSIVAALRKTLQLFKIPGEAQKIDRVVRGFATRYTECNPKSVFNEESAYVVSFSVIMLNTDQHNDNVRKRMSKGEFVKNVKSISDCENFPDNVLEDIYDSVRTSKLSIAGSSYTTSVVPGKILPHSPSFARRQSITQNILIKGLIPKISDSSFEEGLEFDNTFEMDPKLIDPLSNEHLTPIKRPYFAYINASRAEHTMDMFQSVWAPLLTLFNVAAEDLLGKVSVSHIFKGFEYCLKITCIFDLDIERQAFLYILRKMLVNINATSLKKCIYACEVLLKTAIEYGNKLSGNWEDIMYSILSLSAYCEHCDIDDSSATNEMQHGRSRLSISSHQTSRAKSIDRRSTMSLGGDHISEQKESKNSLITPEKEDIPLKDLHMSFQMLFGEFVASTNEIHITSFSSIIISMERLSTIKPSSVPYGFHLTVLQIVSEMCCNNVENIASGWDVSWPPLKKLFISMLSNPAVGELTSVLINIYSGMVTRFFSTHNVLNVDKKGDMIALFRDMIDAKDTSEVHQKVFLTVTEVIMYASGDIGGIWKKVLCATEEIFNRYKAHADKNHGIDYVSIVTAFESISKYSNIVAIYNDNAFGDLLRLYCNFCEKDRAEISSVRFVNLLRSVIIDVQSHAEGEERFVGELEDFEQRNLTFVDLQEFMGNAKLPLRTEAWILGLGALVDMVMQCEIETRAASMECLFDIIKNNGSKISEDLWSPIINIVLYRMFDTDVNALVAKYFNSIDNLYVWIYTTQIHALKKFINFFCSQFPTLRKCLKSVLNLLRKHVCSSIDITSRNGIRCLEYCFRSIYDSMTEDEWGYMLDCISGLFAVTEVQYMRLVEPGEEMEMNIKKAGLAEETSISELQLVSEPGINKAYLSQMVRDVIVPHSSVETYKKMPLVHLSTLLSCLSNTYIDSISFKEAPFAVGSEMDVKLQGLKKNEHIESAKKKFDTCLDVLSYIMHSDKSDISPRSDLAANAYIAIFKSLSILYIDVRSKEEPDPELVNISFYFFEKYVTELCSFNDAIFSKCCSDIYAQLLHLVKLSKEVRNFDVVIKLLEKIGSIYIYRKQKSEED